MKVQVSFVVDVSVGKKGRKVTQAKILTAIKFGIASQLPPLMNVGEWINEDGEAPDIKVICDSEVSARVL